MKQFIILVENQFQTCPKTVRSNNGPGFQIPQFNASKGEEETSTLSKCSEGIALPIKLTKKNWSYAFSYAAFVIKRVNTHILNQKSPHQRIYDTLPDVNQLKVFRSLCYASILSNHRAKLDVRARKSIFLGYVVGYKGSHLLDIHSHDIYILRNVTHHEHILPYQNTSCDSTTQN